jgi:hypothetical protein
MSMHKDGARKSSNRNRRRASKKRANVTFSEIPRDLTSRVRGLYRQVAHRLRVHPSYVSRVARGERRSAAVERALRRELNKIVEQANRQLDRLRHEAPVR